MEQEQAYQLIDLPESQATIYGVLRRLGIDARHPEYEDYAQEAWIIFYLWCLEADLSQYTPADIRKIGFTRMYRRLMNLRYREIRKRDTQTMVGGDDDTLTTLPVPIADLDWQLDLDGINFTKRQRQILWYMLAGQGNQQWVANQLLISRKTVSREMTIIRNLLHHLQAQAK